MKSSYKIFLICFGLSLVNSLKTTICAQEKPNVIIFYVDDLGWMDLSIQGSQFYETPAIDKLANEGIRFTQAYSAHPRCVPARYGVMTGKYPGKNGVPGGGGLSPEDFTIAEAMQAGGYKTFFAGKWHLLFSDTQNNMPEDQGFDINIAGGAAGSPPTYWYPYRLGESTEDGAKGYSKDQVHGLEDGEEGEYLTDRLTDESIRFIESHHNTNPDQPFFLFLSHYGVHTPFEAKADLVEKYEEKLKNMEYDLPEYEQTITGDTKLRQDYPTYAAMIESVDQSMEKLRKTLADLQIDDNTIIIFTADNGGLSTRGNTRTLATSNYPLRYGKGWLTEGGIREAFIVKWPGQTQAGTVTDAITTGTDIYPTVLSMAGLPLRPQDHKDGIDISEAIKGNSFEREDPIFWHSPMGRPTSTGDENSSAVRIGDYKLIDWFDSDRVELFNIKEDIGENNDLSSIEPERTQEMLTIVQNWRATIGEEEEITLPFIEDFEKYSAGSSMSDDLWLSTNSLWEKIWKGTFVDTYSATVVDEYSQGESKALEFTITTKPQADGGKDIKLRTLSMLPYANDTYKVSYRAKTDVTGNGLARIGASSSNNKQHVLSTVYQQFTDEVALSSERLFLYFNNTDFEAIGSYKIWLDDIKIESETATNLPKVDNDDKSIHIYPNPFSDILNIECLHSIHKIEVYSIAGVKLMQQTNNKQQINLSDLQKGIYILKVSTEKAEYKQQIIKHN